MERVKADGTVRDFYVHRERGEVPLVNLSGSRFVRLDELVLHCYDGRFRVYCDARSEDPPWIWHINRDLEDCRLENLKWEPGDGSSKYFSGFTKRAPR